MVDISSDADVEVRGNGRYQWNPAIRDALGEECAWYRLGFNPTYRQAEILIAVEAVLAECGISAYTMYEMIGIHDLMLKAWVPPLRTSGWLEDRLVLGLRPLHLAYIDHAEVQARNRVALWNEGDHDSAADELELAALDANDLPSTDVSKLSPKKINELLGAELVREFALPKGLRFFVVIPHPSLHGGITNRDLREEVGNIIANAEGKMAWLSFYDTSGFGTALVTGIVAFDKYEELDNSIMMPLMEVNQRPGSVRSVSHICLQSEPLLFKDELNLASRVPDDDDRIADLLSQEESLSLEFKGSAFIDSGRYYYADNDAADAPEITDVLLKTVVAMLNTKGGKVVLGVLEKKRFTRVGPDSPLNDAGTIGEYLYPGIGSEMTKSWDDYERKLLDVFRHRITPDPHARVDIVKLTASNGAVLAEIAIDKPSLTSVEYFYRVDGSGGDHKSHHFYIRSGSQSRELSGPDLDKYKDWQRKKVEESTTRLELTDLTEDTRILTEEPNHLHADEIEGTD